ncbi:MAG: 4Fe-4S ferredoxin [Chloroflexi bacterium]|nr:4Fe-4S ferredoxin [Chloroflexota bacterium]
MDKMISFAILGVALVMLVSLWIFGERGKLLRPSTWEGLRTGGLRNLLNLKSLHMYVYGRWSNQYIDVLINTIYPRLGERGKKWWRDRYHAKILTHEEAKAIIKINQDIPLQDLEQIIPYPMARNLMLSGPVDVAAYECPCRHARDTSCRPTQVCMIVGQPFVDFILEHNPQSSRRLTQSEALDLLQAEYERGHLHSAWFKDALFDRFYSICNCCKCCCGGLEAMMKYSNPVIASSGYIAQVDETLCSACNTCAEMCPFDAVSMEMVSSISWEKCMGCGICVGQCPSGAIDLVRDEQKGIPFDVRMLV